MGRSIHEKIGTRVVRTARVLPPGSGTPVVPPLVQSVAFDHGSMAEQDAVFGGERPGYVYGRYGTPTTAALEIALADLDEVEEAVCFVTGMAAIVALTGVILASNGRIVAQEDTYGATRALLDRLRIERGADVVFVDPTDLAAVEAALRTPTAVLFVESISNPLLRVADVAALADRAHAAGAELIVDATFASPALYRPAALGADLVLHSLTKYINGHGDVMGGVIGGPAARIAKLRERVMSDGAYLPPHEAWLVIRGMRTLDLRMTKQSANALAVATHLGGHSKVAAVRYPGLADHPSHTVAAAQFGDRAGAVVTFTLRDDSRAAAYRFLDGLELAASATTIGDLFTEVLHPATASHRRVSIEERARMGISDGLVRISVGIEDPYDIVADLDAALERV
ncbi:MAG TPA: aminotransferase class I/II-fold pyridoxal phosphate-dependent enzyme [Candidatus Saccharimonadales bacterium]|nr:aminotransferase class I/II-fold pyridoxal phosphate-dependent enzyme [Candidatus Saccharimonadales bacterium]